MLGVQQPWRMVLQVIERLVQLRTVVLAISNPLHEGLPMVSPVELLSADNLARLWSGFRPVTGSKRPMAALGLLIGKVSFEESQISDNVHSFVDAILRAKPAAAKGAYLLGASICTSMSPGIKLDHQLLVAATKK